MTTSATRAVLVIVIPVCYSPRDFLFYRAPTFKYSICEQNVTIYRITDKHKQSGKCSQGKFDPCNLHESKLQL